MQLQPYGEWSSFESRFVDTLLINLHWWLRKAYRLHGQCLCSTRGDAPRGPLHEGVFHVGPSTAVCPTRVHSTVV